MLAVQRQTSLPSGRISRRSLAEEVADRIRDGIVTGVLSPGQPLREMDLSVALDLSRSPIRHAIAQLSYEGLLSVQKHRGAVALGMTAQDLDDIYRLRQVLESLAVSYAATRARPPDLAALAHVSLKVRMDLDNLSPREFAEADITFHELVYPAAHHHRLYACWQMLRSQLLRYFQTLYTADARNNTRFAAAHVAIANVMAERNSRPALRLTADHITDSYPRLAAN